jgi:dCMP deaminase
MNKIPYDDYFLAMAYLVAQRSPDPSTKCGAVLVGSDRQVLSTGYNGPIAGADDDMVPLERPAKYAHLLHAEENCLLAYNGGRPDIEDATIYITGAPCHKCLRMIIQKGIYNIVYTDGNLAVMQDAEELTICNKMKAYCEGLNVRVLKNLPQIVGLLGDTAAYIVRKNPGKVP